MSERTKSWVQNIVLVGSIVCSAIGVTWKMSAQFKDFQKRFEAVEAAQREGWTLSQQAEDALRTAIENPGMRVPDPRNPGQIVVVHNRKDEP